MSYRRLSRTHATLCSLATLLLPLLFASIVQAQDQKEARLPGALMLRRIAEAVDGDRSGRQVYVVASYQPTAPVLGVFDNPADAAARAREAGPLASVFGPYLSELDRGSPYAVACVHLKTSVMLSDRCVPPAAPIRPAEITGLSLVITRAGGVRDTLPLPVGADAIFLSMPAIDKFVVPYYQRILGLPLTSELRQDFQRAYGRH